MTASRPTMLVILDGWGWLETQEANAVRLAHTPTFDRLWDTCPHSFLVTCGLEVGLPEGQMGNSEVGHLTIGAGRVVLQSLPRISKAAIDGELKNRIETSGVMGELKSNGGTLHLMGLTSEGGVHSHIEHGLAIARIFADEGIPVAFHAITDGRDTAPRVAAAELETLAEKLPEGVRIVTVCGRYFAMDRDNRWSRTEKAYNAFVNAMGDAFDTPREAVQANYDQGRSDEFVQPAVIGKYSGMKDGDAFLFFNFRTDRVKQLCHALVDETFDEFNRSRRVRFSGAISMTEYGGSLNRDMRVLFPPESTDNCLGEVVSKAGLRQMRMAETEKYPHVTYFLNGGREKPFEGEERILVPSPKVATYDLQPEMSAPELTDKAVEAIASGEYDLLVLNYANPDMVGHTGDIAAAVKAVEEVDRGLGLLERAVRKAGGALLVMADHGNCEMMIDPETGGPHTAHTTNPVPCILSRAEPAKLRDGGLRDIAPTLLDLMGLDKPEDMTGNSLIEG